MNRHIKLIAIPAVLAATILTAAPLAWARGILPIPPRTQPTYECGPNVPAMKASAAVLPGRGHTYRLYTGKDLAVIRAVKMPGVVWCVRANRG